MIGIYKLTNNVNGKFYIGQSQDIERRQKAYNFKKRKRGKKTKIKRAINRYGIENFEFEVILECNIEELDYWEIKLIKELKPQYNMNKGGGDSRGYKTKKKQEENYQ